MTSTHEAFVASRFDALERRFKATLPEDDYRLRGVLDALGPVEGRRILDIGCGKGRFARVLRARGATVVGLDLASGMLAAARGLDRVRGTARRLPFGPGTFDAAVAVEVFQHLDRRGRDLAIDELSRVVRPGGRAVIVDRNVLGMNAERPWLPGVLVKWIDERRGRWMYPAGGPVRERWFWPPNLRATLLGRFGEVRVAYLLSPAEERCWLFHRFEPTRQMTLWVAEAPGGRDV